MPIPSMVTEIVRNSIRYLASEVRCGCVVEVGTFLGACTVEILKGLDDMNLVDVPVHCYDYFKCNAKSQIVKAGKEGVKLQFNKSYYDIFMNNIYNYSDVITHKGDILKSKWDGKDIGLYIDDASKQPKVFNHVAKTFFPSLVRGAKVVLLDYYYYEKVPKYCYQEKWMQKHKYNFEFITRIDESSPAIFLYKGGL